MKFKNLFYLCIILLIGFASCSEDDPKPEPSNSNIVIVDYGITEPTIWYADSIYVIPKSVYVDAVLTIEAGTIIKFYADASLQVWSNGTINAIGTQLLPIIFTSIKDDIGGDTNEDLISTSPNSGDWNIVDLGSQNGSQFKYCVFTYGGYDNYSGVLELGENYSKVEYCIFANNSTYVHGNVYRGALAAQDADPTTIIKYNTFYNNTVPLSINGHLSIDNSNVFSNPEDATQTNTYNGIFVHGQDIISHSTIWQETELAYVIQYDGFEIWDGYSLTLGDNVVLKFMTDAMLDKQVGAEIINYNGTGVYFTSYKDDTHKGDSNGDGTSTTPTATEWKGIYNNQPTNYFYTWSNILFSKNSF
ncbi:MAG: hypothetical protein KAQ75_16000 [Bacteroidales bacterium]|nr:hypothetical protein [Bacteroidales bacterium]